MSRLSALALMSAIVSGAALLPSAAQALVVTGPPPGSANYTVTCDGCTLIAEVATADLPGPGNGTAAEVNYYNANLNTGTPITSADYTQYDTSGVINGPFGPNDKNISFSTDA